MRSGMGAAVLADLAFGEIGPGWFVRRFGDLLWGQELLHGFEGVDQGWILAGGTVVVEIEDGGSETA